MLLFPSPSLSFSFFSFLFLLFSLSLFFHSHPFPPVPTSSLPTPSPLSCFALPSTPLLSQHLLKASCVPRCFWGTHSWVQETDLYTAYATEQRCWWSGGPQSGWEKPRLLTCSFLFPCKCFVLLGLFFLFTACVLSFS